MIPGLFFLEDSVGQGAGGAEVGQELEAEADHKVPDVSGHLRAGDEHSPDKHHKHGVEGVADVPQPERITRRRKEVEKKTKRVNVRCRNVQTLLVLKWFVVMIK